MIEPNDSDRSQDIFTAHSRTFRTHRYVYPVVSRRSAGLSLGVNLNLDKVCNFDCVYCQVQRDDSGEREFVELRLLEAELDSAIDLITSDRIYEDLVFASTPLQLRRFNDIALSGDGEPTTYRNFDEVAALCARVRRRHGLDHVKLVLITNASMFHRERVACGLKTLDENNGEIWAKLDAGTEEYYKIIARSAVPFQRILDNLLLAAQERPIVIQTLFMRVRGESPTIAEQEAYCSRLNRIVSGGGKIGLVQIHTVARSPAETWVSALSREEVDAIEDRVRVRTGLQVRGFYGNRT